MSKKKIIPATGRVYIKTSYNNVIVSVTDDLGNVIAWSSAGKVGFKGGKKKNTPYAAQMVVSDCVKKVFDGGMKSVDVFVSGPGNGRDFAVRSVYENGMNILSVVDITPIPHNGCRPPKMRK